MTADPPTRRRFEIALSFPGERREFVEKVARHLASVLDEERVLYDKYHDAEFGRLGLDVYLPNLYLKDSDLIVLFLCPEYAEKRWCGLELRYIRQLIGTSDEKRIMLLSFGAPGDLSAIGILPGDGYIDVLQLDPEKAADKILKRLGINQLRPSKSPSDVVGNRTILPATTSRLIGRAAELTRIERGLRKHPLLTLTGTAGSGKTILAIEAARRLQNDFEDGIALIDLVPLSSQALIVQTIARDMSIGDRLATPTIETLAAALCQKNLLLVLDNCEHVIADCRAIADVFLKDCPGIRILATSRERLGLDAETVLKVPPLSVPPEAATLAAAALEHASVQLFVDRAQSVSDAFELTDANSPAVVEICRRLEGVPLAIKLAAARITILSPEQIREQLKESFRLLSSPHLVADRRQRSIEAAIAWSFELLTPPERTLFEELAVFSGEFGFDEVLGICSAGSIDEPSVADVLSELISKSMLEARLDTDVMRYRLLESIREYAATRLTNRGKGEELRRRHFDYYFEYLANAAPHLKQGGKQAEWLDRIDKMIGNIRAAMTWGIKNDPQQALRLAGMLGRFWNLRSYWTEGRSAIANAVEHATNARQDVLLDPLYYQAQMAYRQKDFAEAAQLSERCRQIAHDVCDARHESNAVGSLANIAWERGDYRESARLNEEALAIAGGADEWSVARFKGNLGLALAKQGEYRRAIELTQEALAINERIGNQIFAALDRMSLGRFAVEQGDCETAERHLEQALTLATTHGDRYAMVAALNPLGEAAILRKSFDKARAHFQEAVAISSKISEYQGWADGLRGLGEIALYEGKKTESAKSLREALQRMQQASEQHGTVQVLETIGQLFEDQELHEWSAKLLGLTGAVREEINAPASPVEVRRRTKCQISLKRHLTDETFHRFWEEGRALKLERCLQEVGGELDRIESANWDRADRGHDIGAV